MTEPDLAIRLLEELILMRNQSSALLKEVQQLARQHAVHSRRVHHRFAILEEKVSRTESTVRGEASAPMSNPTLLDPTDCGSSDSDHSSLRRCSSEAAPVADYTAQYAQSPDSTHHRGNLLPGLEAERLEGPAHSRPWGLARGSTAATSMGARATRTASMHLLNRGSASLISSQSGVLNTGAKTRYMDDIPARLRYAYALQSQPSAMLPSSLMPQASLAAATQDPQGRGSAPPSHPPSVVCTGLDRPPRTARPPGPAQGSALDLPHTLPTDPTTLASVSTAGVSERGTSVERQHSPWPAAAGQGTQATEPVLQPLSEGRCTNLDLGSCAQGPLQSSHPSTLAPTGVDAGTAGVAAGVAAAAAGGGPPESDPRALAIAQQAVTASGNKRCSLEPALNSWLLAEDTAPEAKPLMPWDTAMPDPSARQANGLVTADLLAGMPPLMRRSVRHAMQISNDLGRRSTSPHPAFHWKGGADDAAGDTKEEPYVGTVSKQGDRERMGKAGNGLAEGSSAVPIPYQGSNLYVRGGFPQEHELMLGDEDDPDRPLTRWDKLYLLAFGLINPEGRTKWDMFILLLLLWVCFASPLIICFGLGMGLHTGGTDRVVLIIELVVDGCFVLDILLNFRTAYLDSVGNLVSDRRRIARHYMRSWFVLDLVSVVPFDILTEGALSFLSMLKLLRVMRVGKVVRMMRVYRLLRVSRLPRILEKVEQYLDKGILQLAMFALSVGLLAHLSACIFHYMSLLTFYLEDSWAGTWVEAQGLVGTDLAHRYLNSLYWAFTTVATVGYGDITPKNQKEKVLAIFVMCSGVTLVGYVTSSISSMMGIRNAMTTKTAEKKQLVQDVLKNRQVPSALARKVQSFFNYESTKLIRLQEEQLLQDLPFKLRSRFLQHAYSDCLSRLPCFTRLRPDVLIDVIAQLQAHFFTEGDIVALQGDFVDAVYFVNEGKLELRVYDFPAHADPWAVLEAAKKDELAGWTYTIQGRMKKGYYFGHAGTVHEGLWPASVITRNCCELYCLSQASLVELAERHPLELGSLLEVDPPPRTQSTVEDVGAVTIEMLQVAPDVAAIAIDFPLLDPPPRSFGIAQLLSGAVKGVGQGLVGALGTKSHHLVSYDAAAAASPPIPSDPSAAPYRPKSDSQPCLGPRGSTKSKVADDAELHQVGAEDPGAVGSFKAANAASLGPPALARSPSRDLSIRTGRRSRTASAASAGGEAGGGGGQARTLAGRPALATPGPARLATRFRPSTSPTNPAAGGASSGGGEAGSVELGLVDELLPRRVQGGNGSGVAGAGDSLASSLPMPSGRGQQTESQSQSDRVAGSEFSPLLARGEGGQGLSHAGEPGGAYSSITEVDESTALLAGQPSRSGAVRY